MFNSSTATVPPQNVDAEEAILGGILLDPNAIARVADILLPEAFYIHNHAQIYRAILALHLDHKPADLMTVTAWLHDQKKLESAGGMNKLAQMVDRTVSAVNIDALAQLVMDKYSRRQIIKAGGEIVQLGYETATPLETVLGQAEQKVFAIAQTGKSDSNVAQPNSEVAIDAWKYLESDSVIYNTGLYDLDNLFGGFEPGTLTVLAGRPSMGKSQAGLFLAHQIAKKHNKPVVFFSLEMSKIQLEFRLWSLISQHPAYAEYGFRKLESDRIRQHKNGTRKLQKHEWAQLSEILSVSTELPIFFNDYRSPSVASIASNARSIISQHGEIALLVVDYLQLMGGGGEDDGKDGLRAYEIGRIVNGLYTMAGLLKLPVLALSQVSRGVEARNNKRPMMNDLAQSSTIEATADSVIALYRPEYYEPDTPDRGTMEFGFLKNRHGDTGTAKLLFDKSCGMLLNVAK